MVHGVTLPVKGCSAIPPMFLGSTPISVRCLRYENGLRVVDRHSQEERVLFTQTVIGAAWERSGGRCECDRRAHLHTGRCTTQLRYAARGTQHLEAWEAHLVDPGEEETVENCRILCRRCFEAMSARR
jgi:hypothetical protein